MHQESWIYRGKLKKHLLQLSHDFSKGTMVMTLDGTTLAEDKLESNEREKTFQFFIDQELCEVKVIREGKKFVYKFIPHIYSTSKVGKTRKKAARWELISVNSGVAFITVGLLLTVVYFTFFSNYSTSPLSLGGLTTVATITEINANKEHVVKQGEGGAKILRGNIRYKFKVLDKWYFGDAYLYKKMPYYYLAQTGLPIQTGDEFLVLYDSENPDRHKFLLDRPSEQKLKQYHLYARESCLKNLPSAISTDKELQYCECLKAYLFEQYDLKGLAMMIHQTKERTEFRDFNREVYQEFMNEERQQEIQNTCLNLIGG